MAYEEKKNDDLELIVRLREGHEAAFKELLQKYLSPLYAFILGLTRDPAASEDIAQETFIKVWKNLHRFDMEKSFKVWLFAIAKNTAYDFLKKKKTLPFSVFEDEAGNSPLQNVKDKELLPHELLEREDSRAEMERALLKVPEAYRALLNLRYKEDFSLKEVADILGEPYNTIKSRHQRALGKLRDALESE